MGGLNLILISVSCYSEIDDPYSYVNEKKTLDVDLVGFWAMANTALNFFEKQKSGHLVGISSINGLRGSGYCPAYCGSKAFISKYLEGVRNKMIQNKIPIYVTDIIPGWVDVEHTTFSKIAGTYWVAPLEKAAQQIFDAIKHKKKIAYITKRQWFIALLLAFVPDCIFNWIGEF
jgi:short-subunit dehydrogenase